MAAPIPEQSDLHLLSPEVGCHALVFSGRGKGDGNRTQKGDRRSTEPEVRTGRGLCARVLPWTRPVAGRFAGRKGPPASDVAPPLGTPVPAPRTGFSSRSQADQLPRTGLDLNSRALTPRPSVNRWVAGSSFGRRAFTTVAESRRSFGLQVGLSKDGQPDRPKPRRSGSLRPRRP